MMNPTKQTRFEAVWGEEMGHQMAPWARRALLAATLLGSWQDAKTKEQIILDKLISDLGHRRKTAITLLNKLDPASSTPTNTLFADNRYLCVVTDHPLVALARKG